ncbi:MAG: hypothetical protein ACI4RL_01110 [Ruminococcus sp.]
MRKIEFSGNSLVEHLYSLDDIYCITSETYWDGGFQTDATLKDKANFYHIAELFSRVIKEIIVTSGDKAFVGNVISEKSKIFEEWKDIKNYDSYNNLKNYISKKGCYEISLPADNNIIDYIVENNFCYLSCIDLYLPKSNIILQPSCHTEVFIYSDDYDLVLPKIKEILKEYPEINLKKYNCGF